VAYRNPNPVKNLFSASTYVNRQLVGIRNKENRQRIRKRMLSEVFTVYRSLLSVIGSIR